MRRTIKSLDGLYEIPESMLQSAVQFIPDYEESGIRDVLSAADEYRAANLTPIFIFDQHNMDVLVVCKETFGKRLH